MVTAEVAMASLVLVGVLGSAIGIFGLVVTQVRCIDAAAEIARQSARGDAVAVSRMTTATPPGAEVTTSRTPTRTVVVTVTAPVRPVRGVPVTVHVVGRAEIPLEPGVP
jgi:hypothetical protein